MRLSEYCQKFTHNLALFIDMALSAELSILNANFQEFKFFLPLWRD